jgi:hypothetical protein
MLTSVEQSVVVRYRSFLELHGVVSFPVAHRDTAERGPNQT